MEFNMDLCEHAYYKPEEKYTPRLYCNLEDKMCIYSKRCLKVDRFIPLEGEKWRECYKYIMDKRKNIPQGSYLVQTFRPNKNGKLYLYILTEDDKIEKILTNFEKLEQDYVYLRKTAMGSYQVSLEPFVVTPSMIQKKKEVVESKENTVESKESTDESKEIEEKPKKRTYNKKKEPKNEMKDEETKRD